MAGEEGFADQYNELLSTAGETERQLAALGEAIALADAHQDIARGLLARQRWITAAFHTGRREEQLVHFTWCIAQCDRDPRLLQRFGGRLLWHFKWMMASLPEYSGVSRQQIERTFADMERFHDKRGVSHRAIHSLRANAAMLLGDFEKVAGLRSAWLAAPRDGSEDCEACEVARQTELFLATGELEKAVEAASGLIAGRLRCGEQPFCTDSVLLAPLFRLGRVEVAERLQRRSWPKLRGNAKHLAYYGGHMAYLVATDRLTRGVHVLEEALNLMGEVRRPYDRLLMLKGAMVLLSRLGEVGRGRVKMRLRSDVEVRRADNAYDVGELLHWARRGAEEIAAAFDARNGNRHVGERVEEDMDLLKMIRPYKAAAPARREETAE
jgi:hypothetical protein